MPLHHGGGRVCAHPADPPASDEPVPIDDPLEEHDLAQSAAFFVEANPDAEPAYWQLLERVARLRNAMRLLSLTADADDYPAGDFLYAFGWARARLWEQYASSHAGVCLVFDRERLHGALSPSLHSQGMWYDGVVEYSPRGFYDSAARTVIDGDLLNPAAQPERLAGWAQEHHRDLFFRKTDDWRSEYEHRYVLMSPQDTYAFADFGDALVRVIVGSRFPAWQLAGALAACGRVGAELRRMSWNAGMPYPGRIDPDSCAEDNDGTESSP